MITNVKNEKLPQLATPQSIVFDTYSDIIGVFCKLDDAIVKANMASIENFKDDNERLVSLPMAVFVSEHFGTILAAAVLDFYGFRDVLGQAIDTELQLDDMSVEAKQLERSKMSNEKIKDKSHAIEMGVSFYNHSILMTLLENVAKSHARFSDEFVQTLEQKAASLTEEDKMLMSFIFSNFIYLVRALNNNGKFVDAVIDTVIKMESRYSK